MNIRLLCFASFVCVALAPVPAPAAPEPKVNTPGEVLECLRNELSAAKNQTYDQAEAACRARATPRAMHMFHDMADSAPDPVPPVVVKQERNSLRFINPNVEGPLPTPRPR